MSQFCQCQVQVQQLRNLAAAMTMMKERSELQEARTGEEVGAPVIVLEHGEHVLDAAARRRIRFPALLGSSIPAQPSQEHRMAMESKVQSA